MKSCHKTYLIKRSNNDECFLKVGITSMADSGNRHDYEKTSIVKSGIGYNDRIKLVLAGKTKFNDDPYPDWTTIIECKFEFQFQNRYLEQRVKGEFKGFRYTPKQHFAGWTECFVYTEDIESRIKQFMVECEKSMQLTLRESICCQLSGNIPITQDPIMDYHNTMARIRAVS